MATRHVHESKVKYRDPRIEKLPGGQFAWSCDECGNGDVVDAFEVEKVELSLENHHCDEEEAFREHKSE